MLNIGHVVSFQKEEVVKSVKCCRQGKSDADRKYPFGLNSVPLRSWEVRKWRLATQTSLEMSVALKGNRKTDQWL